MPASNEPKVNNVWKSNPSRGLPTETVTLPSGQTCVASRVSPKEVFAYGLSFDMDVLVPFVDRIIKSSDRVDGNKELRENPEILPRFIMFMDRTIPHLVVQPRVKSHFQTLEDGDTKRIPLEDRDPETVYTDEISLEDKMFLVDWAVSGDGDATPFRQRPQGGVENLANSSRVSSPPKRRPRRKR